MNVNKPSLGLQEIVQLIDGNKALQDYKDLVDSIPPGSGYIRDYDTGEFAGVRNSVPIAGTNDNNATVDRYAPVSSHQALLDTVDRYNSYIDANDLNEEKINFQDYFDENSPLSLQDGQDVDAEGQYLQNQLFRMQKDQRYVPDYEDIDGFDKWDRDRLDELTSEYNNYISSNGLNADKIDADSYDRSGSLNHIMEGKYRQMDLEIKGQDLQNQLYKLQGDDRYVAVDDSGGEMSDEELEVYEKLLYGG